MTIGELAAAMGAATIGVDADASFDGFCLDHREARPGAVFLAIRGKKVDGHDFVGEAIHAGCVAAVVERQVHGPHLLVSSLVDALAGYASGIREGFAGPVIGVTGSVGKTTTKELLAAAMSPLGPVLANPGSRNTEYTLPLLWHELRPEHRSVVAEMGMRGFGQIAHLASFSRPTIGVVTNVGVAHAELVGGPAGVPVAKGELLRALPASGVAVIPADVAYREILLQEVIAPLVTFGYRQGDAALEDYEPRTWTSSTAWIRVAGRRHEVSLPFLGQSLAVNAAAALLAAHVAGVDVDEAAQALGQARMPPNRMEVREIRGATVVLDAYNAGPPSVAAALEAVASMPRSGRLWVVMGDMRELGDLAEEAHRKAGTQIADLNPDFAVFIGEYAEVYQGAAVSAGLSIDRVLLAENRSQLVDMLRGMEQGDVLLVKASRALELERVVDELTEEEP
ncbi:MAG: UDP-N-acetylmuramoyl-tripeptide--D-alanyl-D-alanine ligase [Fimbriimonadaceae bacterium]